MDIPEKRSVAGALSALFKPGLEQDAGEGDGAKRKRNRMPLQMVRLGLENG